MPDLLGDLRVEILTANFSVLDGNQWGDPDPHADPFARLYGVRGGAGRFVLAGRRVALSRGDVALLPAGVPLQHHASPGLELYWIHFTARVPAGASLFDVADCEVRLRPADGDATAAGLARFERIVALAGAPGPGESLERQGLLRLLLAPLVRRGRPHWTGRLERFERFRPVLAYIDAHLAEPVDVATLAALVHLHPTYFANRFAEAFGAPPRRYLVEKRVERAQLLLQRTDDAIKTVAARVGYPDVCYFTRVFRKVTGLTPAAYRARRRA